MKARWLRARSAALVLAALAQSSCGLVGFDVEQ
jgi:hypothetical protein